MELGKISTFGPGPRDLAASIRVVNRETVKNRGERERGRESEEKALVQSTGQRTGVAFPIFKSWPGKIQSASAR